MTEQGPSTVRLPHPRPGVPPLPVAEHVVFGAGAVGLALAEALVDRGETGVRVVHRSGRARVPAGVQVLGGDARDPGFAVAAARGARVVYQVLAPAYHRWTEEFPALQAGALAAAEAAGARLVVLENVYAYGAPVDGSPLTEDSPFRAHTRKGRVRARMTAALRDGAAGRVELAIGRASNYFGPRGGVQAVNLGDQAMLAALTGGRAQVLGDPDQPHTYTYLPDIARGLAVLGTHPAAAGRVWHLPNDPRTRTTRELLDIAYRLAGHPRGAGGARITRVAPAVLRALGIVKPPVRETVEMLYEFEQPFVVDSRRIADELGVHATPAEQALAATLDTYR